MNDIQLMIMNYRSKILSLERALESYRSSKKYEDLHLFYKKQLDAKNRDIRKLKDEYSKLSIFYKREIRKWITVTEEMQDEHEKQMAAKDMELRKKDEALNKAYLEIQEYHNTVTQQNIRIIELEKQLEEERGKNAKLTAQVNRDYENSSIPSSSCPNRKKIVNGRKQTGRKQGGQKGHQAHYRKQYKPNKVITIQPPEEYLDTDIYVPTGKIIKKQVIDIKIEVTVTEYQTQEFRKKENRQKVHAPFPKGIVNEVNYGNSVQAIAYLFNCHYNVSCAKTRDFLHEASHGVFSVSTGFINQLGKKFNEKSKKEQEEIFDALVKAPVQHTDFTTARCDGKQVQTLICAVDNEIMFYPKENKGHKGIEGTPVKYTTGILVHDHDRTFYNYGENHQECMVHCLRYLKDRIENEPHLSWNTRMYHTVQKMIHYKNTGIHDEDVVRELIKEYDENLKIAELNYENHPPSKYYREGYNLAKRMREYRDNHLLFLFEDEVPADNNLCERYARVIKRKMKQMTSFRSFKSFEYTCAGLGVMETLRKQEGSLLSKVEEVFDR